MSSAPSPEESHIYSKEEMKKKETVDEICRYTGISGGQKNNIKLLSKANLTPDAPDELNIDTASQFQPICDSEQIMIGDNYRSMWIAKNSYGDKIIIKFDTLDERNPIMGGQGMQIMKKLVTDKKEFNKINLPNVHVDDERVAVVMEYIDDARPLLDSEEDRKRENSFEISVTEDDYYKMVGLRMLFGSTDLLFNTLVKSNGDMYLIDFDEFGHKIEIHMVKKQLLLSGAMMYGNHPPWEKVDNMIDNNETNNLEKHVSTINNRTKKANSNRKVKRELINEITLSTEKAIKQIKKIIRLIVEDKIINEMKNKKHIPDYSIRQLKKNINYYKNM